MENSKMNNTNNIHQLKSECDDLESDIENLEIKKEMLEEKRRFLEEEYSLKVQELKNLNNKSNHNFADLKELENIRDDNNETEQQLKEEYKNAIETFYKMKPDDIVNSLIQEYNELKKPIDNIYEKNKVNTEDINYVLVKFQSGNSEIYIQQHFRIIDNFYCFIDLFKDSCHYFNVKTEYYRLFDSDKHSINLTISVKKYLNIHSRMGKESHIEIYLKPITKVNIDDEIKYEKNHDDNKNEDNKFINIFGKNDEEKTKLADIEDTFLNKIKGIILYLVFLCAIFIYNMSKLKINDYYHLNQAVKNQILNLKFYQNNKYGLENSILKLHKIDDIYVWLFDSFMQVFHFSDDANVPRSYSSFLENYIVIGYMRIIQLKNCNNINKCFKDLNDDQRQKYISTTVERNLTNSFKYKGLFDNYSNSTSYYFDALVKQKNLSELFFYFKNNEWIDSNTQLLAFILNGYNYNTDTFITLKIILEQSKVGKIIVDYNLCNINMLTDVYNIKNIKDRITDFNAIFDIVMNFILFIYLSFRIYIIIFKEIIIQWNKKNKEKSGIKDNINNLKIVIIEYFSKFWNWILCFKLSIYLIVFIVRILIFFSIYFDLIYKNNEFVDTTNVCSYIDTFSLSNTVMICVTLIYFLQFLDENILDPIIETLKSSLKNIFVFIISYAFTITGYAIFCNYVFGPYMNNFKSIDSSIIALFFMIFGDFNLIPDMAERFPQITRIFFLFLFALSYFMLFTNWLTSTIIVSYQNYIASKAADDSSSGIVSISFIDEIINIKNKLLRSLIIIYKNILSNIKDKIKKN